MGSVGVAGCCAVGVFQNCFEFIVNEHFVLEGIWRELRGTVEPTWPVVQRICVRRVF